MEKLRCFRTLKFAVTSQAMKLLKASYYKKLLVRPKYESSLVVMSGEAIGRGEYGRQSGDGLRASSMLGMYETNTWAGN